LPNVPETYVHRIGRTGRAGASGIALSFCDGEEKVYLRDIQKLITSTIPVENDHPFKTGMSHSDTRPAAQPKNGGRKTTNRFSGVNKRRSYYNAV